MATKAATNGKPVNRIADLDLNGTTPVNVVITAPNLQTVTLRIRGTAPYLQNKFSAKAKQQIKETQEGGSKQAKKGKAKDPKNFDACFKEAQHIGEGGWHGMPASAFRSGMIDACRLVGFKMTHAKLAVFVEADGLDKEDGSPLVKIIGGAPEKHLAHVRLATGVVDLRCRPMWRKWEADVRITFDADMFTPTDIANLMARLGRQVGIGEGRPNSKQSYGQGFGTFEIVQDKKK